jgi:hypothetical protein
VPPGRELSTAKSSIAPSSLFGLFPQEWRANVVLGGSFTAANCLELEHSGIPQLRGGDRPVSPPQRTLAHRRSCGCWQATGR